jgi:hypothetical protein
VLTEVRRMIVPMEAAHSQAIGTSKQNNNTVTTPTKSLTSSSSSPSSSSSSGARSVVGVAATKLIKIGMSCIESKSNVELLCEVCFRVCIQNLSKFKNENIWKGASYAHSVAIRRRLCVATARPISGTRK